MTRLVHLVSVMAAVALAILIATFSGSTTTVHTSPIPTRTASSTLATFEDFTLPVLIVPDLVGDGVSDTRMVATTAPVKSSAPKPTVPANVAESPVVQTVVKPIVQSTNTQISFDTSAAHLRDALVNILCYAPGGSRLHSISGTGVLIDPKGIILTNAHIAQYFLLTNLGVSCTIRSGSPATDRYLAELMFISSSWIRENANTLTQHLPSGTGEEDFALLAVTASTTRDPLPPVFPHIPLAINPPAAQEPVVIGTYGAQFLSSNQVRSSLTPTLVFGSIKKVYTFKENTVDVFDLGGSAAAQEGSSGGGVANGIGELIGTITTSTVEGTTDTRTLNAITASYMRAAYASATGSALDILLAQPTALSVTSFAVQIPALRKVLVENL